MLCLVVIALAQVATTSAQTLPDCRTSMDPSGEPIGGGTSYSSVYDPLRTTMPLVNVSSALGATRPSNIKDVKWFIGNVRPANIPAMYFVDDMLGLTSAMSALRSGDVIFIDTHAVIDLLTPVMSTATTAPASVWNMPTVYASNVTLASGRGVGPGALLMLSDVLSDWGQIFLIKGNNVRFTGLRLLGPNANTSAPAGAKVISGMQYVGVQGGIVDNCEITQFSGAAVAYVGVGGLVAYSHIHHNQQLDGGTTEGYGVGVSGASSIAITGNYFNGNRHDISGSGDIGQNYTARYNVVGQNGTGQSFDMHGQCEIGGSGKTRCPCINEPGGSDRAGTRVIAEYNTFLRGGNGQVSILLRGVPLPDGLSPPPAYVGATFRFNCVLSPNITMPFQRRTPQCYDSTCARTYLDPRTTIDASVAPHYESVWNRFGISDLVGRFTWTPDGLPRWAPVASSVRKRQQSSSSPALRRQITTGFLSKHTRLPSSRQSRTRKRQSTSAPLPGRRTPQILLPSSRKAGGGRKSSSRRRTSRASQRSPRKSTRKRQPSSAPLTLPSSRKAGGGRKSSSRRRTSRASQRSPRKSTRKRQPSSAPPTRRHTVHIPSPLSSSASTTQRALSASSFARHPTDAGRRLTPSTASQTPAAKSGAKARTRTSSASKTTVRADPSLAGTSRSSSILDSMSPALGYLLSWPVLGATVLVAILFTRAAYAARLQRSYARTRRMADMLDGSANERQPFQ